MKASKRTRMKQVKTVEGYLKLRRKGEFGQYQKFREVVSKAYAGNVRKAENALSSFRSGSMTKEMFECILADEHVEQESAKDYLVRFLNGMTDEAFVEFIEEIYGGLLTRDEFIGLVYGCDPLTLPARVYFRYQQRLSHFARNEREVFDDLFQKFMNKEAVDERVAAGMTRDEVFKNFVDLCIGYNVFPIIAFPEGRAQGPPKYRLVLFPEKSRQLNMRVQGIVTNMGHTAEALHSLESRGIPVALPPANGAYKKLVTAGTDPAKVLRLPQPKPVPAPSKFATVRKRRSSP